MAERAHLDWFRGRLAVSSAIEPKDPAPILAWREERCRAITFKAELIGGNGRVMQARTCTLPARGRPVLESWPQKAKAVRVGDFKPAVDPGACDK